ncbi:MAG: CHAT domain-containing protein [Chloroflexota bacterium]
MINFLLAPGVAAQEQWLRENVALLADPDCGDGVAGRLKAQADYFVRVRGGEPAAYVRLLDTLAELTGQPAHRALAWRAAGNLQAIVVGDFGLARDCYDQAAAIYRVLGRPVEEAMCQVGKVSCLTKLAHYEEAFRLGQWARQVLAEHQVWPFLAGLLLNLATTRYDLGEGEQSLDLLQEAWQICQRTGAADHLGGVELNRALTYNLLGDTEAAVRANQIAHDLFTQRGQMVEVARTQFILAIIYSWLGRFNEALALYDQALVVFQGDNRPYDALLVPLFHSHCLLQFGRYEEARQVCRRVNPLLAAGGAAHEAAQAVLHEAIALAGLGDESAALATLDEARALFLAQGNRIWAAVCDLERAALLYRQQRFAQSYDLARLCAGLFQKNGQSPRQAQALLLAAWNALALGDYEATGGWIDQARAVGPGYDNYPSLRSQGHHLGGRLAWQRDDRPAALAEYDQAIRELEQLRGQLMVEFRADFLADKGQLYQEVVELCLLAGQSDLALSYAERAKSRALLEMIAGQIDVRVAARSPADQPLVDELQHLLSQSKQVYRRLLAGASEATQSYLQETLRGLEARMTRLWNDLQIRHADYARDAALTQVQTESARPYLDGDTLLIEYFVAGRELVVFLVSREGVAAHRLSGAYAALRRPALVLSRHLETVPVAPAGGMARLVAEAQQCLGELYDLLLRPVADVMAGYRRLIVVPHGRLHHLPFHALYDGRRYLIEQCQVSYLPAASLLRFVRAGQAAGQGLVAFGYSAGDELPHAVREAQAVARMWGGQVFVEEEATLDHLRQRSPQAKVLHLATHGLFNRENPLFSSLALADGQLTTLDIFHLRLEASLVTLSACETGRHVVTGGDELLGLMRAFLYAGANSLVLGLWRVFDQTTLLLMEWFYERLAAGQSKGEALRAAQLSFMAEGDAGPYRHPYYWAPFVLVGDSGRL